LAGESGERVTVIATAEAGDVEMASRIAAHRAERPAGWTTVEEPLAVVAALGAVGRSEECVVIDCLTLWVANFFGKGWPDGVEVSSAAAELAAEVGGEVAALLAAAAARDGVTIVVSNEVGSGIVPADARSRLYEDVLGAVNSAVASAAERVYLCVAGQAVELKSLGAEPV
jgi:adenosylcobinamide kinase/adenosylcobinamide-phosphate guanylyltransferase